MKALKQAACAVAVAATCVSCRTEPVTGRSQFDLVGGSSEAQMGAQAYQEVLSKATIIRSGPQYDQVVRVGRRIAEAAEDTRGDWEKPNFDWEFNLIKDDKTVNAFCLPGGKIAVYTGILPIARTDEGLAVVLGHEVGHAVAHHGGERVSQSVVAQLGLGVVDEFLLGGTSPAAHEGIMTALGAGVQFGALLPFSRTQESSADEIGLHLMTRAGYPPREAVEFWKRMEQASGGGAPLEFLSTHPSHETRIRDLEQWIPEVETQYGGSAPASGRSVKPQDSAKLRGGEKPRGQ